FLLAWLIHGSVVSFSEEMPGLVERASAFFKELKEYCEENIPWLADLADSAAQSGRSGSSQLVEASKGLADVFTGLISGAVVVGFYLIFLLLEVRHLPRRIRAASSHGSEEVLEAVANINHAISGYIRVKVIASLLLAAPVTLILFVFGVKFPLMWGGLTFICNFIPYLGSIVAISSPLLFSFLQFGLVWQPFAVMVLVVGTHVTMTYAVELRMTGKAVGLSPLVILVSLSFWGLCWGLVGMFLAVPLTVVTKIVLENIPTTKAF